MAAGTEIQFIPPTGFDTTMIHGASRRIATRYQCITSMQEYENKSLEELRYEDYISKRIHHPNVPGLRKISLSTCCSPRHSHGPHTTPGKSTSGLNFNTAEMSTPWSGTTGTGTSPFGSPATTTSSFSTTQPTFGFSTAATGASPFGTTSSTSTNNSTTAASTFSFGAAGTGTPPFGTTTKNSSVSSFGFGLNTPPFGATGTPRDSAASSLTRSGTSFYQTSGRKECTPSPNDVKVVGSLWYERDSSWQVTWTVDSLPERSFEYGIASPEVVFGLDNWRLYVYPNGLPISCPGEETQSAALSPSTNPQQSGAVPESKTPGDIVLAIVPKSVRVTNPGQHFRLDVMLPDKTLLESFRFKEYSKDGKFFNRNFVLPHEIAKSISFSSDRCSLICKFSMETIEEPRAEASSQVELTSGTDELAKDLKNLLLSEEASDATVRVKGQDFKVHRIILGARTPVFSAMFRHDTSERTSGIVDIEDCEPDIFRMFLQYVYSGQVEGLTAENAAALYEVANKYQVNGLKQKCLEMVKTGLSVESLCDAISLSLKHDERELTTVATGFFADNIKDVIRTVEWQNFLTKNPIPANELLIKAHQK